MAKQTRTVVNQQINRDMTWQGTFSLEQREAMIREAAYYHYQKRGGVPGHELDDWLAAEAELELELELERRTAELQELPPGMEIQQSGVHGARKDDKLKRMVKQHPQKAIPQIDSVEPEKAPAKE
ncbi:DUF2934 domain-containing protein [Nitrosomonas communis]|uniref:DUF2934 domain-containing protein n=1 Tax=Nitrosomonas communis TaxID=44574 RepID=UPI0026F0F587|nr:DUF2934 domain-containing protein [Nitrosomonas communis]MCO6427523.1 DUF2934 domain-containing protein [Nitrosomonas communis]